MWVKIRGTNDSQCLEHLLKYKIVGIKLNRKTD